MKALKEYTPKSEKTNTKLNTKSPNKRLIYHPLGSKYLNRCHHNTLRQHSNMKRRRAKIYRKTETNEYEEIIEEAVNNQLNALRNYHQNCTFFFNIANENVESNTNSQTEITLNNNQQSNTIDISEYRNFNCIQCNKWFFCKRISDHERECPIINRFNGGGDKSDQIVADNNQSFRIGNDNIIRNSVVCYLCGNRYSIRSIVFHEDRCIKKFERFFHGDTCPKKPIINESELDDLVIQQISLGNVNFSQIDAFNEIMFKESLKNESLLKSRLKYNK